jgi:putative SOS response-associated peptidase YedK
VIIHAKKQSAPILSAGRYRQPQENPDPIIEPTTIIVVKQPDGAHKSAFASRHSRRCLCFSSGPYQSWRHRRSSKSTYSRTLTHIFRAQYIADNRHRIRPCIDHFQPLALA